MPLSLMTVPVLGEIMLRSPVPRPVYRTLLTPGQARPSIARIRGAVQASSRRYPRSRRA